MTSAISSTLTTIRARLSRAASTRLASLICLSSRLSLHPGRRWQLGDQGRDRDGYVGDDEAGQFTDPAPDVLPDRVADRGDGRGPAHADRQVQDDPGAINVGR